MTLSSIAITAYRLTALPSYGEGTSHPPRLDNPGYLLLGAIFCLFLAVVSTVSGETLERYRGIVNRAEEPKRFRMNVAMLYGIGIFLLGFYFYTTKN